MSPTGVIDNLIPTVSLPGCISGIFPGLKVFVSLNLIEKADRQLLSTYSLCGLNVQLPVTADSKETSHSVLKALLNGIIM